MTKHKKSSSKSTTSTTDSVLLVPCKRCGALPGKSCRNTKTNSKRRVPHDIRIETAKKWKGVKPELETVVKIKEDKKKSKPTEKQQRIIDKIANKIEVMMGYRPEFKGPVVQGPMLSIYKFVPHPRLRVSALEKMHKDLTLALGGDVEEDSVSIRVMPGESAIGIFVPHPREERKPVLYTDTVQDVWQMVQESKMARVDDRTGDIIGMPLPLNLGMDYLGNKVIEDLTLMPHLMVAGSTGGGKSVLIKAIVSSLVYSIPPERLKLAISDTKEVEFKLFDNAPHMLMPRAKSIYETMQVMEALINESERRQKILAHHGCENIHQYNLQQEERGLEVMPYILFIIDELADVVLHHGGKRGEAKVAEEKLGKIVYKSRFTGIYSLAGTQRPSHDVIKGSVKANYTCRLCFRLPSSLDSRVALTQRGAEQLMSRGDMLFYSNNRPGLLRLHAPFVSRDDMKAAVEGAIMMHAPKPEPAKDPAYSSVVVSKKVQ